MPLVTSKEMLLNAQKGGYAVGAFNAENMEMVKAIIGAAETFSMLSEKRVVWVRDFRPLKSPGNMAGYGEDGIERLTKYMENPNDGAILVLSNEELDGTRKLAKAARKYGKVYEMGTVSERELVGFAAKRFRELGVTVSKQQMREIITALLDRGIQTRAIWGLINEQLPYEGEETYHLEKAPYYASRILNLPCSTQITREEILTVCREVKLLLENLANCS